MSTFIATHPRASLENDTDSVLYQHRFTGSEEEFGGGRSRNPFMKAAVRWANQATLDVEVA